MQLYNTKVIPQSGDALWSLPSFVPHLAGKAALVVSTPFADESAEAQTLQRMMAACKLSPDQYAVIQMPDGGMISWQSLRGADAPKIILLLGIAPAQLNIGARFTANEPVEFGGSRFLWSYPLGQIIQPDIKKTFWEGGLKPLFGLK